MKVLITYSVKFWDINSEIEFLKKEFDYPWIGWEAAGNNGSITVALLPEDAAYVALTKGSIETPKIYQDALTISGVK